MLNEISDIYIELPADVMLLLSKPIRGRGGFQSLLRGIQNNIRGNTLRLTPQLQLKIARYANKYGSGGFQQRLLALLQAAINSAV